MTSSPAIAEHFDYDDTSVESPFDLTRLDVAAEIKVGPHTISLDRAEARTIAQFLSDAADNHANWYRQNAVPASVSYLLDGRGKIWERVESDTNLWERRGTQIGLDALVEQYGAVNFPQPETAYASITQADLL